MSDRAEQQQQQKFQPRTAHKYRLGNFVSALPVYQEIADIAEGLRRSPKPAVSDFVKLIQRSGAFYRTEPQKAEEVLSWMREARVPPDHDCYHHVVQAYALASPPRADDALRVLEAMKAAGLAPSLQTYNFCMHVLGREGRAAEAVALLDGLRRSGLEPNTDTAVPLLLAHANATPPLWEAARDLAGQLSDAGDRDGRRKCFSIAMSAMARAGRPKDVEGLLAELDAEGTGADAACYVELINAHAHASAGAGGARAAEALLDRMAHEGLAVDARAVVAVLNAHARAGRAALGSMERLFGNMERMHGAAPTREAFNVMMDAHAEHGDTDKCHELLETMRFKAVAPDSYSINALAKAYARAGRADEAVEKVLGRDWLDGELAPDAVTYNTLLFAFARAAPARPEAAIAALSDMAKRGIAPQATSYTAVIMALSRARPPLVPEALAVAEQMEADGFPPKEDTFHHLLEAIAAADSATAPDDVRAGIAEMRGRGLAPGVPHYCALLRAHANAAAPDYAAARRVLTSDMQRDGVRPDAHAYAALMAVLCAAEAAEAAPAPPGRFGDEAMRVVAACARDGVAPTSRVLGQALKLRARDGARGADVRAACATLERLAASAPGGADAALHNTLMNAYAASARPAAADALRVFGQLCEGGAAPAPNRQSFAIAALAHSKLPPRLLEPRRAEALLEDMEARGLEPDLRVLSAVAKCYASCVPPRPRDAERMLTRMLDGAAGGAGGFDAAHNLTLAFGAAVDAYARLPARMAGHEDCLRLLAAMAERGLTPPAGLYNLTLKALAKARPLSTARLEALVAEMCDAAAAGGGAPAPDGFTFSTAIRACTAALRAAPGDAAAEEEQTARASGSRGSRCGASAPGRRRRRTPSPARCTRCA